MIFWATGFSPPSRGRKKLTVAASQTTRRKTPTRFAR